MIPALRTYYRPVTGGEHLSATRFPFVLSFDTRLPSFKASLDDAVTFSLSFRAICVRGGASTSSAQRAGKITDFEEEKTKGAGRTDSSSWLKGFKTSGFQARHGFGSRPSHREDRNPAHELTLDDVPHLSDPSVRTKSGFGKLARFAGRWNASVVARA
ncbi:hypothetical protein BDN71DRAFT_1504412 [Pleurotus eryngii]|uniref:Uncharacterized protein n=1 Tax=Pleurotus eryngii TaxID=5323 RepID=A0A9P6A356_PLEER|nr:hypothetical protein BDN71DRAFT_1504412 [Pleurotus eryngii]